MSARHSRKASALAAVLLSVGLVVACAAPTLTPLPSASPVLPTNRPTDQPTDAPTDQPTDQLSTGSPASPSPSPVEGASPTASPAIDSPSPATPAPSVGDLTAIALSAELVVDGLPDLIFLADPDDGSGVLYAVAQEGTIWAVSADGAVQQTPLLDIRDRVRSGGEQGLLGLAFHLDFATNKRLFVNYTDGRGDTILSEFVGETERILLTVEQPFGNHNGGMVAFGSDGYLYVGLGDGGSGGDPLGNGQSLGALLGKILRVDVDGGDPYGVPADNPFVGADGAQPEIWSLGWRNPWRFSFDRLTGDMWVGDVGQNAQEEIDAEPAGVGGRNYGWNTMEGDLCFRRVPCSADELTLPVAVNDRARGECAIVGGYVYRGTRFPDLAGAYVYSDNCSGGLWALDAAAGLADGRAEAHLVGQLDFGPTSFGEDANGELYLVSGRGAIYRMVASPR